MAVRLNVNANVTGQAQVNGLNRSVQGLGRASARSATQLGTLEAAAARGRASFASLGTAINVGVVAGLAAAGFAINRFIRDTFEAGNLIESLEIRFNLLFGSAEQGAIAFQSLNEFAARVPFSLEDIAAASGNLAVVADNAEEMNNLLEVTGNVAAATGLSFRQTAEQIQRSFAGGIASADVFRERGVRAMLGFQAGVTVSVEETRQRFQEVFGRGGTFGSATDQLAQTLQGQVSLVQDAYFQFRRVVSEQFFSALTQQIRGLVGDFQTNSAELERIARRVGTGIGNALQAIEDAARFTVENWETITQVFRAFLTLKIAVFIQGITAAIISLNVAAAANPIGAIILAVTTGITAIMLFREEIGRIVDHIRDFFGLTGSATMLAEQAERTRDAVQEQIEANERLIEQHQTRLEGSMRLLETHRALRGTYELQEQAQRRLAQLEVASAQNVANKRMFQELVNAGVAEEEERQQNITNLVAEQANIRRRNFQDVVAQAEKEALEAVMEQGRVNRENGRLLQDNSNLSEEATMRVLENVRAWESVNQYLQDQVAPTIADEIVGGIQEGTSALDIFKNVALNVINDIARNAISSGFSDIFNVATSGGRSGAGGASGIFGSVAGIFGFNQGGIVPGNRFGPNVDSVPALLTPGERVIPRDEVNNSQGNMRPNITNINISGNVDQRAIDQIRSVIATSPAEVGGSNRQYTQNTNGLKSRNS